MTRKTLLLVPLLVLIMSFRATPQISNFSLKLFDNITTIDFGNLAFINGLASTQQIFYVEMIPAGVPVRLQGKIEWQRTIDARNREMFVNFRTNQFTSQNFYNTDLGSTDIQMDYYNVTQSIINDLMALGRPSGIFWFTLEIIGPNSTNVIAGPVVEKIVFLNPSQSLMVLTPLEGGSENVDNVLVQWTPVNGVTEYKVKANIRKGQEQSPEEALNQGNPVLDNYSAGVQTSVLLNSAVLNRQWNAGDEIVLQVSAYVAGPGGGQTLYSNIVTFNISGEETATLNTVQNNFVVLLNSLESDALAADLAKKILSGELQLTGQILLDGQPITMEQLMELLRKLLADNGTIIGITPPNGN
ncbi:MAG: hypothetical protein GX452_03920 [Ignavibacteriales bacterium]|nr:hypothetical protein [Ignavibacteriales bacterium]HOJ17487.1 hypothetical protein [Ignavibacteriaceae bacterium]HPO54774.1 hypothetical protein [Ignavibacteriaceae bacterium]